MLRIGIVGCGIVTSGHLRALVESEQWQLAALADIDPARVEEASGVLKPERGYDNYRDLLRHPKLDAVIVATHVESHHPITVEALDAGLHVLCEKPMADSDEHCREMIETARRNRRLLAINFNTRCGPHYLTIKRFIESGALGKVRVVRFVYDWSAHQWQPPARLEAFMAGGGPIVDSGVHFFDGIRWFTGEEIERIEANGVILPPYENPQHVIATCKLSGGAIALVEAGWLYTKRTKDRGSLHAITVIGDDGAAHYDDQTHSIQLFGRAQTQRLDARDSDKHFEITHALFVRSIREGRLIDLASGEDGYKATRAALEALASAKRLTPLPSDVPGTA
jgi:predicted dehydrogenase